MVTYAAGKTASVLSVGEEQKHKKQQSQNLVVKHEPMLRFSYFIT